MLDHQPFSNGTTEAPGEDETHGHHRTGQVRGTTPFDITEYNTPQKSKHESIDKEPDKSEHIRGNGKQKKAEPGDADHPCHGLPPTAAP